MKCYYRLMLGSKNVHADECYRGNFIGVDFDIESDLSNHLYDDWKKFNQQFVPVWMEQNPGRSKISAGLSCGFLWTVAKGMQIEDIVLCRNEQGNYYVGEIIDNYGYHPGQILQHRRSVKWYSNTIDRSSMTDNLRFSAGSIGTVSNISKYAREIEILIAGNQVPTLVATDPTVEDPSEFALEKHLEDFLVANWKQTELGRRYDIYEEEGEIAGQQYPTDTGSIDILAISKDKKELLVVELKKGRVSDNVLGQIQRYMGYVQTELAEEGQKVKGVIIALEDDLKIKRALSVAPDIEFYRYQVSFKLYKP